MPIQSWHCVWHTCRNSWCVNPEHLELLTREQHVRRRYDIPPKPGMVRVLAMRNKNLKHGWATPEEAAALHKARRDYAPARQMKPRDCRICTKPILNYKVSRTLFCSWACRQLSRKIMTKKP